MENKYTKQNYIEPIARFDLQKELSKFMPQEFIKYGDNYTISEYDISSERFIYTYHSSIEPLSPVFEKVDAMNIVHILNSNKISMSEFKLAIQELGWI